MHVVEIDLDDLRLEFLKMIFDDITNQKLTNDETCKRIAVLEMAMSKIEALSNEKR